MSNDKLNTLLDYEGFDSVDEFVDQFYLDSVVPGICVNPWCNYCCNVEPDQNKGWCEICETNTVMSGLMLLGIM